LFVHLCNPKASSRYSTTEALEHPWFTAQSLYKCPLSFDEGLLWNSLKSVFFCVVFAIQAKERSKGTKIRIRLENLRNSITESKIGEEQKKVNRREQYSRKIRLMRVNPILYQAIYGNKGISIDLCFTPRQAMSSDKLPAIILNTPKNKHTFDSYQSLKLAKNVLRTKPVNNFLNAITKPMIHNKANKKKEKIKIGDRLINVKHGTRNITKTVGT